MRELLNIAQLRAGYGEAVVLSNVSLTLAEGQALALLGRNGMGKTTLVNTIVGVTRYISGTITLDGADITKLRPDQRAHAGVGWVPQERNIFKSLTVQENLTAIARPGPWSIDKVYALFPRLEERRRSKAWRRSSSRNCWRRCAGSSATKACRRSWSSRTPKRFSASPTTPSSSSVAAWCTPPRARRSPPTVRRWRPISASPTPVRGARGGERHNAADPVRRH